MRGGGIEDIVIAAMTVILAAGLVPSILNRQPSSLSTCISHSLALAVIVGAYFSLGLIFATTVGAIESVLWGWLGVLRWRHKEPHRESYEAKLADLLGEIDVKDHDWRQAELTFWARRSGGKTEVDAAVLGRSWVGRAHDSA